ncbi:hypothetical protein BYT27DRAFT_7284360 [Phlegmacium glaucopus]|nr:hypothetical protein BYT27DRAFT_7284360 [Phlegmacium glaucopus]
MIYSEFTVPSLKAFNPAHHVKPSNIRNDQDRHGFQVTIFALPQTKTSPDTFTGPHKMALPIHKSLRQTSSWSTTHLLTRLSFCGGIPRVCALSLAANFSNGLTQ